MCAAREKMGKTLFLAFHAPPCRFSGQLTPHFGKIGTGDIVSYFHKKIKTLKKCKPLENVPFAIFVLQSGFPHLPQSLVSHPVENIPLAPPAFYALHAEIMPGLSTKSVELSTCKSGERGETLGAPRAQTCGRGLRPLHPNRRSGLNRKNRQLPPVTWGYEII